MIDRELSKWSSILLALAYLTAFMALAAPLGLLFGDSPLALTKAGKSGPQRCSKCVLPMLLFA